MQMIADLASTLSVPFYRLSTKPAGLPVDQISKPKIGILYTYSTSEPEGWTRWLLDHGVTGIYGNAAENEFDYIYLNPISIDTGYVNGTGAPLSSFNVIIIPPGVSLGTTAQAGHQASREMRIVDLTSAQTTIQQYLRTNSHTRLPGNKNYGQQLGITPTE